MNKHILSLLTLSTLLTMPLTASYAEQTEKARHWVNPTGVWFLSTTIRGGPADGGRFDAILDFDPDGTVSQDTTFETGANPLGPVEDATPLEGLWKRKGKVIETAQLSLVENCPAPAPAGFGIVRILNVFQIVDRNTMVGIGGALDCLPCAVGQFGEPDCPNPTELDFPEAGPPVGDTVVTRFKPFRNVRPIRN